jgi:epoxyqueuosine reductase
VTGLKNEIRETASRLGIDLVGFASLTGPAPGAERLALWLAAGRQASMTWMERDPDRRSDPRALLDGAKTILCAGLNYYTPARHSGKADEGKISRYAWGDDYHDLLGRKLEALLESIRAAHPGINGKVYVDTGPVMEKAWGQTAGLGWQGKHTNLISQEIGSWFFLGEIILDAVIEPDAQETDHCGNCALCIEACPTGAIVEPYVLDAGLCISYLTIEHRGPFPADLAGRLDGWLFGCDVCQEVCPWNDRAGSTAEPAFAPRGGRVGYDPLDVVAMTEGRFREEFRKSPVRRAKHDGLRRNAEALLGAPARQQHPTQGIDGNDT